MNGQTTITTLHFHQLTSLELYEILQLRQVVFVVEQECPYLDADGKDLQSLHMMLKNEEDKIICYVRILPKDISYPEFASIGRVVCRQSARGCGHGRFIMTMAIAQIRELYPGTPIKIGAQVYLKKFYESLGFIDIGEPYIEDSIPHIIMTMP